MDQGLAALIAGIAGAVGGLGGAIAGGFAAARGARIGAEKTAAALLRQTQDQGEIEHQHWAREQRRVICTEVMKLYEEFAKAVVMVLGPLRNGEIPSTETQLELVRITSGFPLASRQVELWGPTELGRAATVLAQRAHDGVQALNMWGHAVQLGAPDISARQADYEAVEIKESFAVFLRMAGQALRTPND
ncbi:hypothetical protein ACF064_24445 [Streptomyces sp. NPDC015492]|uniref:hypothetical protein n=1 Tax=Streptomyces sp. NPDC015492 TaxID=3364958 RepID=UPI0036FAFCF3